MKIITLGNRIQLKIEQPTTSNLNTESLKVSKEIGEVIGIGSDWGLQRGIFHKLFHWFTKSNVILDPIKEIKIGDRVMFKAWAIDIITDGKEKYYFLCEDTKGLCAVIKK